MTTGQDSRVAPQQHDTSSVIRRVGILAVENSLRDNGGLRIVLDYADRWRGLASDLDFCLLQEVDDGPLAPVPTGLQVRYLSPLGRRFRYGAVPALVRLTRLARRADVVLSGSEVGNSVLLGYVAARLARRPLAILVQADLDDSISSWVGRPLRAMTRWINRRADLVLCVSDGLVPPVTGNGTPPERVHVVPNGIDVDTVRRRAGSAADAGPAATIEPTVISVGRLCSQKNFPHLVRAHQAVREAGHPHRLVIVGEGPDRQQLQKIIDDLDVGGSVTLAGHRDNPYPLMAGADLFVLPSRTEGFPLVLLEALALGLPIVSTGCGAGASEILADGVHGQIVPVGSVPDLAAAITRHLDDPGAATDRAAAGPARANEFDINRSSERMYRLLADLARPRRGA